MRNTSRTSLSGWATYVLDARRRAVLSQSELARRVGVDRVTVYRWEKALQRPESPDVVQRFADVVGAPVDEALAAAGMRPGTPAPRSATLDPGLDPDVRIVLRRLADPTVSEAEKATIRATLRYLADLADRTPPPAKRQPRKKTA